MNGSPLEGKVAWPVPLIKHPRTGQKAQNPTAVNLAARKVECARSRLRIEPDWRILPRRLGAGPSVRTLQVSMEST